MEFDNCRKCGKPNTPGNLFCEHCGAELVHQVRRESKPEQGLVGAEESGGRKGGRVHLDPSLLADDNDTKSEKPLSRFAQAAAKRQQAQPESAGDWLSSLRDSEFVIPGQNNSISQSPAASSFSFEPSMPPMSLSSSDFEDKNEADEIQPFDFSAHDLSQSPAPQNEMPKLGKNTGTNELPDWLMGLGPKTEPETSQNSQSLPSFLEDNQSSDTLPSFLHHDSSEDTLPSFLHNYEATDTLPSFLEDTSTIAPHFAAPQLEPDPAINRSFGNTAALPDWLRDLSGPATSSVSEPQPVSKPIEEKAQPAKPQKEETIPDWLREVATSSNSEPKLANGDSEVNRTLDFAFDEEKTAHNGLAGFNFDSDFAASAPEPPLEEGRTGFTSMLNHLSQLVGEQPESAETESATAKPSAEPKPIWGDGLAPWLQGLQPPKLDDAASATTPDWLNSLTAETQAEESPRIGDLPERTSGTRKFAISNVLQDTGNITGSFPTIPVAKPEAEPELNVPDWLRGETTASGSTLPFSLSSDNLEDEETAQSAEIQPFSLESEFGGIKPAMTADEDAPSWLQDMLQGKPVPPVNTYGASSARIESSFKLNQNTTDKDLPDWLRGSEAQEIKPATGELKSPVSFEPQNTAEAAAPSIQDEDDLLLSNLLSQADSNTVAETPDIPDWLKDEKPAPVSDLAATLPDWLNPKEKVEEKPENMQPFSFDGATEATQPGTFSTNGSSQNTSTDKKGFFDNDLPGGNFLSDSDVPAWLRTVAQPGQEAQKAEIENIEPELEPERDFNALPAWLRTVGAEEPIVEEPEPGSIAGLNTYPEIEVPTRLAGADVLAALLHATPATIELPSQTAKTRRFNSGTTLRYLTSIALLAVALLGLFVPIDTARVDVTPNVQNFYNTVERVAPDQRVLMVYDWEADKIGEMRPMAQAITEHLMNRRAKLVTLSLNPQGPALANQVVDELLSNPTYGNSQGGYYDYGKGFLNLGYWPGSDAAVRGLFTNLNTLNDYRQGQVVSSYPIMNGLTSLSQFDMVVVLAGDELSMRTWIEQFATTSGAKLLLGVPSSVGPVAQPYAFGPPAADAGQQGQLARPYGLLVGLNSTVQYDQKLQDKGLVTDTKVNLKQRLTAQSFGALLLIVIVVVTNIIYFARKRE